MLSKMKDFLALEIRKPVLAFGNMLRWIVKQSSLCFLRLLLWSFFFMLPSFSLLLFAFHWLTAKMQEEMPKQSARSNSVSQVPVQPRSSLSNLSVLHVLSQDFRFWQREIERFRR